MKSIVLILLFTCVSFSLRAAETPLAKTPLRALLITGGCCHDYPTQTKLLSAAVAAVTSVEWTIVSEGGTGTRAELSLYDNPKWADPYDVVVHNECFADTSDPEYIRKITAAHRGGKPAVVVHCAMHTYRASQSDDWREFLGVTSRRHDHQSRYLVRALDASHPVMKDFPQTWLTPPDELYLIEKLWPGAKALAVSVSEKNGKEHPVIWTNSYHGTRVFGTTFGHGNATWEDPVFGRLLTRGLLWAAGREN
jgi:type 1 glutamine amidotransferase